MNLIVYPLEHLIWNFAQQACDLFVLANLTPQKKNGRNMFCEVFSQGIEELRLKTSKNGESHRLGDVMNTPLELHSFGQHTSTFCFSKQSIYRRDLKRLVFVFIFVLIRPPPSFYMRLSNWSLGLECIGCQYYDLEQGCHG